MTLEEAQMAKIDLALGKLGLQPGMTLLDIGCGWGSVMKRAIEKYDVNVIGLTLSKNQCAFCQAASGRKSIPTAPTGCSCAAGRSSTTRSTASSASKRSRRSVKRGMRRSSRRPTEFCPAVAGWYCRRYSPTPPSYWPEHGISITMSDLRFMRFIAKEIFPGGASAVRGGHRGVLPRARDSPWMNCKLMNQHYVRTLDTWAANLEARRDEAIAATSERGLRALHALPDWMC